MKEFVLFAVMLTRPGAEALLLWLLDQGYRVETAGNAKVPIECRGTVPVVQVDVAVPDKACTNNPDQWFLKRRVLNFFEERKIGYLFLLVRTPDKFLGWEVGGTTADVVPTVPTQWDRLKQDE